MAQISKTASDGSVTRCPDCDRVVRGAKGLKAHQTACNGRSKTTQTKGTTQ